MVLKRRKGELPRQLTVDFSGVSDSGGGRSSHLPEGDYVFEVMGAIRKKKQDADSEYIRWQLKAKKGVGRGTLFHITSLREEQLWSLRDFLTNLLGKEIPKKALSIDLDKYKGKLIGATVEDDDPYEGKEKSRIAATFPASEYSEDEEESDDEEAEEEVTVSKPVKKAKKAPEPEEEDEDEEEEEEDEEEDDDELDVDDL